MGEDGGGMGTRRRYFLGAQESTKEPVCDEKVKLIKLEGGTAAPPPWQVKA